MPPPKARPPRIQLQDPWPSIDCGRYPVKRSAGDTVDVWADIFRDGHEQLGAAVRYLAPGAADWVEAPMRHFDSDRWTGSFVVTELGRWQFVVAAWGDRIASWRGGGRAQWEAAQEDPSGEVAQGAPLP